MRGLDPRIHRSKTDGLPGSVLLHLDAGVLDHLAPALLFAAEIAVEFLRGRRDHDEPLVRGNLPERLRLQGLLAARFSRSIISGGVLPGANRPYQFSST